MDIDEFFMKAALIEARKAADAAEVPVGAVLVMENMIIASGYNQSIGLSDPSAHAEMQAIRRAASLKQNYRLTGASLYVTLEPCMMCLGALLHARISRLVVGAPDTRVGALQFLGPEGSLAGGNHRLVCREGVLAEESRQVLQGFFQERRQQLKTQSMRLCEKGHANSEVIC